MCFLIRKYIISVLSKLCWASCPWIFGVESKNDEESTWFAEGTRGWHQWVGVRLGRGWKIGSRCQQGGSTCSALPFPLLHLHPTGWVSCVACSPLPLYWLSFIPEHRWSCPAFGASTGLCQIRSLAGAMPRRAWHFFPVSPFGTYSGTHN